MRMPTVRSAPIQTMPILTNRARRPAPQ
jgi:hypothetical protein